MVRSKVHFCIEYVLPAEAAALAAAARVVTEPRAGAARTAHRWCYCTATHLSAVGHKQQFIGVVYLKLDISCVNSKSTGNKH